MYADIERFVTTWLPEYARDNRNYLTVAIGCRAAGTARCTSSNGSPRRWARKIKF